MSRKLSLGLPFYLVVAISCAMGISLTGGCPLSATPQVPEQPADTTDDQDDTQNGDGNIVDDGSDNGAGGTIDRPVTLPEPDEVPDDAPDDGTSGGGDGDGGSGGGGGTGDGGDGDGGGGVTTYALQFGAPVDPATLRIDLAAPADSGLLPLEFRLSDPAGVVSVLEIVLARDDDEDGEPDGDPVYAAVVAGWDVGNNDFDYSADAFNAAVRNNVDSFVVGLRGTRTDGTVDDPVYAGPTITLDSQQPYGEWVSPATDNLVSATVGSWPVAIWTTDTSTMDVTISLDTDMNPTNGFASQIVSSDAAAGIAVTQNYTPDLPGSPGTYFYYVKLSDGALDAAGNDDSYGFYASVGSADLKLGITNRMIGPFKLDDLANPGAGASRGAILRGKNLNDLAGSAMASVPDLTGDGADELVVISRFGKPYNAFAPNNAVGFGEAYLVYGRSDEGRLSGEYALNSTGSSSLPGLLFAGIRTPNNVSGGGNNESLGWTFGLSDVTVIPDMDGDDLPEIVFSFPRVESVSLAATNPAVQLPNLLPDLPLNGTMGELEYSAWDGSAWTADEAHFTRGGVVIVSSQNPMLQSNAALSRRGTRTFDLHEVGQLFDSMGRPGLVPYIRQAYASTTDGDCIDCDNDAGTEDCGGVGSGQEAEVLGWNIDWDMVFTNQSPGGFLHPTSFINVDPPLASLTPISFVTTADTGPTFPTLGYPNIISATGNCPLLEGAFTCDLVNNWYVWGNAMAGIPFPGGDSTTANNASWNNGTDESMWTGFYGPESTPQITDGNYLYVSPIGARVLGQKVDDEFGTAVASDGTWLYITAPGRTANDAPYTTDIADVDVAAGRTNSGIVYMLQTYSVTQAGQPTRTQLWIEPNRTWPEIDAQLESRVDYTMPAPHNYIIESVGSLRLPTASSTFPSFAGFCPPEFPPAGYGYTEGAPASIANLYLQASYYDYNYPANTAGDFMDKTRQIVGPHINAAVSAVRALGDVNGDSVNDFAIGSASIWTNVFSASAQVGGLFIVYGREPGVTGDLLLEDLARDPATDPDRFDGVFLKGANSGEKLARVVANADDFNGDGYADVLIGSEGRDDPTNGADAGAAYVMFGATDLLSPAGGWTADSAVDAGVAVRFVGEAAGDMAGANVSRAGNADGDWNDLNGDGVKDDGEPEYSDILIAAPVADYDLDGDGTIQADEQDVGIVYLIYGSPTLFTPEDADDDGVYDTNVEFQLADVGTLALPGVKFIGRKSGDKLGGGEKVVSDVSPSSASVTAYARALSALGKIDSDDLSDFAISAMLADPGGKTDAGEVYVIYGQQGDQVSD
jgi:hypothetical protein